MAENSKIEWTHHTFNPWRGCTKVSDGCKHCYAETMSKRNPAILGIWGDNGTRVHAVESYWRQPLKWNRDAEKAGERRRVFCASLADVFEDHPAIMPGWRARLGDLIYRTPHLDWLLLTKRPENVNRLLPDFWINFTEPYGMPSNVWLGTTVENQEQVERIPHLLNVRAAVRFLSCEPLLGPIDLSHISNKAGEEYGIQDGVIDWVICGGESGPGARPMHPDWARSLRDQCKTAGIPFFFKQWGEWEPYEVGPPPMYVDTKGAYHDGHTLNILDPETCDIAKGWEVDDDYSMTWRRVGKKAAGRTLDGRTWDDLLTTCTVAQSAT